jgi:hypothetical protein
MHSALAIANEKLCGAVRWEGLKKESREEGKRSEGMAIDKSRGFLSIHQRSNPTLGGIQMGK